MILYLLYFAGCTYIFAGQIYYMMQNFQSGFTLYILHFHGSRNCARQSDLFRTILYIITGGFDWSHQADRRQFSTIFTSSEKWEVSVFALHGHSAFTTLWTSTGFPDGDNPLHFCSATIVSSTGHILEISNPLTGFLALWTFKGGILESNWPESQ